MRVNLTKPSYMLPPDNERCIEYTPEHIAEEPKAPAPMREYTPNHICNEYPAPLPIKDEIPHYVVYSDDRPQEIVQAKGNNLSNTLNTVFSAQSNPPAEFANVFEARITRTGKRLSYLFAGLSVFTGLAAIANAIFTFSGLLSETIDISKVAVSSTSFLVWTLMFLLFVLSSGSLPDKPLRKNKITYFTFNGSYQQLLEYLYPHNVRIDISSPVGHNFDADAQIRYLQTQHEFYVACVEKKDPQDASNINSTMKEYWIDAAELYQGNRCLIYNQIDAEKKARQL